MYMLAMHSLAGCAGSTQFASTDSSSGLGVSIAPVSAANGVEEVAYSTSLTATGGKLPYSWSVTSGTLPAGLNLNSLTGVISGAPQNSGTFSFAVTVVDSSSPMQSAVADLSITILPSPVAIVTSNLPSGQIGGGYSATLVALGGASPYTWALIAGALPSGLSLSSGGVISGTPSASGSSSFTVQVKDAANNTATQPLSISVAASLVISSTTVAGGQVGSAYSTTLQATGGTAPYSWSLASGALPSGLSLSSGGVISGTPSASGSSSFTVQVKDAANNTATQSLRISVAASLVISSTTVAGGQVSSAYSTTLQATGGTAPYSWSLASGALPSGLSLSSGGVISGTPSASGSSSFTVQVKDAANNTATQSLSISVAASLVISSTTVAGGQVGSAYSTTLQATGGTAPYSWSLASGALPSGLSLSSGGVISGTPSASGSSSFTVQVKDAANNTATQALSISVAAASLVISSTTVAGGQVSSAYSTTLQATGGTAPYSWSLASGALPSGLSLSSGGVISGTPSASGSSSFTVQVKDAANNTATQALSISVAAASLVISSTTVAGGQVSSAYSTTLQATGGTAPYSWSLASGALPSGLSLSSGGVISGTPSASGSSSFTVQVKDAANNTATQPLSISVAASLVISSTTVAGGQVGSAYSTTLQATGGTAPYSWSLTSGALPSGLSLSSGGVISGTPSASGSSSFTVQVKDAANNTATQPLSISVAAASSTTLITSDSLLNTGTPASVTYAAPGSNSGIAIVTPKSGGSNQLWEFYPDPFSIGSGSGTINMAYSGNGSITSTVNLTGLNNQGVNAYPFIFYGGDPYGDQIGGQPPQFPAQLDTMSSLIADVNYSLSGTFGGDIDVLFDEWLIPTANYTGGISGALEVEILPYYSFVDSSTAGLPTFTAAVTVNGTTTNMEFYEYVSGLGAGNDVVFSPVSNHGIISGEVRFNMLDFLNEATTATGLSSSWFLAGIELGTEFGDGPTENFTFTVTKLDIEQTLTTGN